MVLRPVIVQMTPNNIPLFFSPMDLLKPLGVFYDALNMLGTMKLSQIRALSWSTAVVISVGCTFGIWSAIQQARRPSGFPEKAWIPQEPEIPDFKGRQKLGNQRIMSALSFITKVEPPPKPPEAVSSAIVANPEPIDKTLDLKYELSLISYDDNPSKRMVFLSKDREEDPYSIGDDLEGYPKAKVSVIAHDYVELLAEDGRTQVLYLRSDDVTKKGGGGPSSINRISEPAPEGAMNITPEPPVVEPVVESRPARRYVPTTRDITVNDEYGIQVVKYSNTPDGEERYAINDKDLASLQNQALRLMSEVAPSTAYGENGSPLGIRLDFVVNEPLAAGYGIKSGDILTKVDGKPVTNTQDAQGIYDGLNGNKRAVPFEILRNGNKIGIYLEMDDFPGVPSAK
jgi:type II secretory pathway component PulC